MRATVLALVLMAGSAAMVAAQPVTRLADVALEVDAGDRVAVVDTSGITVWGRLTRVTPEQLVIEEPSGQARTFAAADLRRIERRGDSLGNGMRLGVMIGGVLGGAFGSAFSGEFRTGDLMQGVAIFGAVGVGLGLAFDAAHVGRTTVFAAPDVAAAQRRQRGGGVAVGATWAW